MVAWAVLNMGGEVPKTDPTLLPDNAAAEAWNTDLLSGPLDGLNYPEPVIDLSGYDLSATAGTAKRAYRVPSPSSPGTPDAWLPLPSPYSSVMLSPLANDSLHRVFWTNPSTNHALANGYGGAFWLPFASVGTGAAPFNLGFTAPDITVLTVAASGGTTGVPLIERSYLYTLIDVYGNESSPSVPSDVVAGLPDADWQIGHIPGSPGFALPSAPGGKHYPAIAKVRLYRTVTGTSGATTFYRVADFTVASLGSDPIYAPYHDATPDTDITGGLVLTTSAWQAAPDKLDGLTSMPGGFFVGFVGNTIYFSEPDHPHAWPAIYDLAVPAQIVALALWNQTLVILTQGYPATGTGSSPSSFTLSQVNVAEPCLARGSVVTDLLGVYYGSPNGVIQLTYFGMQNQTLQTVSRPQWLTRFISNALDTGTAELIACRHRAQYIALRNPQSANPKTAWIIDYTEQRLGVVWIDHMQNATSLWNDVGNGDALYMTTDKRVWRWDPPGGFALPYRWRSKVFNLIEPVNLAACEITIDPDVLLDPSAFPVPDAGTIAVPGDANCLFRLWANGVLRLEIPVAQAPVATFRLPSGYVAHEYQFEIVSNVPVTKVKLATSMKELDTV